MTADKLHNLSSTLRDVRSLGAQAWKYRMAESPNGAAEKQLWYYRSCEKALSEGWSSPLLNEFRHAVTEFEKLLSTP